MKKKKMVNEFKKEILLLILVLMFIILSVFVKDGATDQINSIVNSLITKIQANPLIAVSIVISNLFENLGVTCLTCLFVIYLLFLKRKKESVIFGLVVILSSFFVILLKNLYQVARPVNELIAETDFSFPSGHTTFAVVFFGLLAYFYLNENKKNKIIAIIISAICILLVAFSRIYLNVHSLTDIFGGFLLGSVWLIIGIILFEKYQKNRSC